MSTDADLVMTMARELRRSPNKILLRGVDPDAVSFTHLPVSVPPDEVLHRLRNSSARERVLSDGDLMNSPRDDWYVDLLPVHSDADRLVDAYVSVSLWEPPEWQWIAGELEVRLVFEENGKRAHEAIGISARPGEPAVLYSYVYDHQRAETGYEGDGRSTQEAQGSVVEDFLHLVRAVVAAPSS
jgi:hypothetical protein